MKAIYLGLGGNLGDRLGALRSALIALRSGGLRIDCVSSVYDTDPVGFLEQQPFLNLAVSAFYAGTPEELLGRCLAIEKELGRVRGVPNGPRTIDIDILLWGDVMLSGGTLEIPHPRMHLRRFVLVPLTEIAPEAVHPALRLPISELLARCPDPSSVRRVAGPEVVDA